MANVIYANSSIANISVTESLANITVTDVDTGDSINVSSTSQTVTVGATFSNVEVGEFSVVSDDRIRASLSATQPILFDANTGVISTSLNGGQAITLTDSTGEIKVDYNNANILINDINVLDGDGNTDTGFYETKVLPANLRYQDTVLVENANGTASVHNPVRYFRAKVSNTSGFARVSAVYIKNVVSNANVNYFEVDVCDANDITTLPCVGITDNVVYNDGDWCNVLIGGQLVVDYSYLNIRTGTGFPSTIVVADSNRPIDGSIQPSFATAHGWVPEYNVGSSYSNNKHEPKNRQVLGSILAPSHFGVSPPVAAWDPDDVFATDGHLEDWKRNFQKYAVIDINIHAPDILISNAIIDGSNVQIYNDGDLTLTKGTQRTGSGRGLTTDYIRMNLQNQAIQAGSGAIEFAVSYDQAGPSTPKSNTENIFTIATEFSPGPSSKFWTLDKMANTDLYLSRNTTSLGTSPARSNLTVGANVIFEENLTVSDTVTATSFSGDGSGLSGLLTNAQVQTFIQDNGLNGSGNIATTGVVTFGNSATQTHNFTGNINVTGNIEVDGNLNYRNVEDLYVQDQSITLNANAATDATSSIIINRPVAGANTVLRWNETDDKWEFTNDGSTFYPIPTSTSDLAEGTNQYYTDARSRAAVSVTQASASGNGTLSYDNGTGVFTYTPPDLSAAGLTNAQVQAFIEADGLDMTGNMTFTGATITSDALISTTGNLQVNADTSIVGLKGLTFDSSTNRLGIGTTTPQYAIEVVADDEVEAEIGITEYNTGGSGPNLRFARAEGTVASPSAIGGNGDRIGEINFAAYDGTSFITPVNLRAATDDAYASVATGNVPWVVEIVGYEQGNTSGLFRSFQKLRSNGAFELGKMTTDDGTGSNITLEGQGGNIRTIGGITASGTISGATLTDTVLSVNAGAITNATTGTFSGQVQAGTLTDGTLSITGGNISTAQNIGATGTIDTNGLIKTFGGNVEAPAGNIVGAYLHGDGSNISGLPSGVTNAQAQAYIQENGLTMTSAITSNSNIETTSFFVGDIDGAVVQDVRNETGATLSKGKAVYLTGSATGDNPHVALADADDSAKMPALGIVYSDIANASVGQVATSGVINVASHGFTQGADLFISATAGDLSETAPTGETGLIQKIGKVVGPNHILVQGAFRTNATPNLNENNIFIGNATNQATTVALDNLTANIKTTGNLQLDPSSNASGLLGLTYDSTNHYLGLGTETPEYALHIVASGGTKSQLFMDEYDDGSSSPDIRMRRAEGLITAPRFVNTGEHIGQWYHYGWRENADPTGNAAFSDTYGGSFATTGGVEISSFADGDYLVHHLPVGNLTAQGGSLGDRLRLTDQTIRFNDGTIFVLDGTTNANLTSLNGKAFYVDQGGGSTSRTYDLYYDEARTNPVQVATGTEDFTDGQANVVSVAQPVGIEFIINDGSSPDRFSTRRITKLRANGEMQFGCSDTDKDGTPTATIDVDGVIESTGNITTTANINSAGATFTGAVTSNSNITTTANVSGGYILGNGSQLTGIAASYGNAEVTAFLDSDTMTGNIEYTGNLLVGAPTANVNVAVQAYFGNVNTGSQDQFQPTSNLDVVDGAAVSFHSQAGGTPLTFLNGNVYYVTSVGGGVWNLFEDAGLTTQLKSGLDNESGNINGLTVEYVGQGTSKANIEGSVFVTNSVEAEDDVKAGNALFGDRIYPFTGGGTIGFTGARMSDVGLGGGGGNDFFWPETGRPNPGSLLIAGAGGQGYWSQGLVLENETLTSPVLANISSSTTNYQGSDTIYRRSRGNISAPTAVQENSGSNPDVITSVKYQGHDGTTYQPSFFSNVFVDGPVSANNVPMAMEISTWENGDLTKTNSGFGFPILKLRSNRSIEFNSPNPLNYNNPQGNANITADGSINSNANITTVANINAAGATFTGTVTSNSLISTTANVQINSETQVDGIKGLTYDTVNNYLGLGTPIPEAPLHILSDSNGFSACVMIREFSTGTSSSDLRFQRAEGSLSSPATMNSNDRIGQIRFDPLRASIPGNVSTYDFGTTPTEITAFADGTHGATTNLAVASYTIQSGAVGDEFLFSDRTVTFNDGDGVLFNGATNANLAPLNGNVFYVNRGGGSSARTYDIYYDEALTNPVHLTGDTSDVTGLTAELRNVYQPVGLQVSTIDTNSDGTLNINNHKFRADGNVEFGCTDQRTAGTGNVIITPEGSITVGDRLKLKSYSNTDILALTDLTAGEVVYNSTDNLVAYYDGTNWRNIAQGAIVT